MPGRGSGEGSITPSRRWGLGYRELQVIKVLAESGGCEYSTYIYKTICPDGNESCRKSVQASIRNLKTKGYVRRTRRHMKFVVCLTREGKRRLLELLGKL